MVLDGDSDRPFLWKMTNPRMDVSYNTSDDVKKDLKIDQTQSYFQLLQRPFGNVYYWPDIWNCYYALYKNSKSLKNRIGSFEYGNNGNL